MKSLMPSTLKVTITIKFNLVSRLTPLVRLTRLINRSMKSSMAAFLDDLIMKPINNNMSLKRLSDLLKWENTDYGNNIPLMLRIIL